jgi:hypothetical protein
MASLPKEKAALYVRMERIEKQNRQLKSYMAVLAVSFLSVAMLGAAAGLNDGQFNQITARGLTIVDDSGRERVLIGSAKEGTGISVFNMAGKKVLGIGLPADEEGSGILFADKEGRPRIGLGLDQGLPSMAFVDDKGKKIIGMGGDRRGYGLTIMDENEVERAGIGFKEGNTGVVLYDDKGQYVRGIVRQKDGLHYFSYVDEKGNELVVQ